MSMVLKPIKVPGISAGQIVARAGTEVTCPDCGALIGTLRVDVYQGLNPGPELLRFHPKQVRRAHEPCECKRCGGGYWKTVIAGEHRGKFLLHTKAIGWVS